MDHPFISGQIWRHPSGECIYICAVNDDVVRDDGSVVAGEIFCTDERPQPLKGYEGVLLSPLYLQSLIEAHKIELQQDSWHTAFQQQEVAMLKALAPAPHEPKLLYNGVGIG